MHRLDWQIARTDGNEGVEVLTMKPAKSEIVAWTPNLKIRSGTVASLGRLAFLAAVALFWTGCHHRAPVVAPPTSAPSARRHPSAQAPIVQGQEGIASWYGRPYDGRPTASGQVYNMYAMTAAHRTLPFGTLVRVHDLENGHSVVVRINDRGPFVEGRIIDLSYAAAMALHMPSTALVRLQILRVGPHASSGTYSVQIGAFLDRSNAERLKHRIEKRFRPVMIKQASHGNGVLNLVLVGEEGTRQQAEKLASQLIHDKLAKQTYVVRTN